MRKYLVQHSKFTIRNKTFYNRNLGNTLASPVGTMNYAYIKASRNILNSIFDVDTVKTTLYDRSPNIDMLRYSYPYSYRTE